MRYIIGRLISMYSRPVARRLMLFSLAFAVSTAQYVLAGRKTALISAGISLILFVIAMLRGTDPGKRLRLLTAGIVLGAVLAFSRDIIFLHSVGKADGYEGPATVSVYKRKSISAYGGAYYTIDFVTADGKRGQADAFFINASLKPGTTFTTDVYIKYDPENRKLEAKFLSFNSGKLDIMDFVREAPEYTTAVRRVIYPKHLPVIAATALSESIERAFPADISGFVKSITVSDREEFLKTRAYSDIRAAGAAHIVAVSGMHVSFLVAMLTGVFRRKKISAIIGITVIFLFTALVGFTPNVLRAALMQSLVLIAPLVRRRSDGITSASLALLVILLIDPFAIAGIGLALSFFATLGLSLITPRVRRKLQSGAKRFKFSRNRFVSAVLSFLISSLSATIGALAFTIPIIAYSFGTVSLIAPITNILVLWAVSLVFCAGIIIGIIGLIWMPLASVLGFAAAYPARYIIYACSLLSKIPYSQIYTSNRLIVAWLAALYIAVFAYSFGRAKLPETLSLIGGAGITLILALALPHPKSGQLTVTAVSVGQGQCIVVTYGSSAAVFDCGSQKQDAGAALEAYCQSAGITRIETVFLTHYDYDHTSGIDTVLEKFSPETVIVPTPRDDDYSAENVISTIVAYGTDTVYVNSISYFTLGDASVSAFRSGGGTANDGLIYLVTDNDWDVLIMGDADSIAELVYCEAFDPPDIELLIVGHHGSKYSTCTELLEYTKPEAAIISVGENSYGHPTSEVLGRLEAMGIEIFRTDRMGNVTICAG